MADRLIAMEAEKAAIKDQLLRTMAEMENVRKRSERKVAEERIYAVEKFSRDLLNVADNLARALAALTDEANRNSFKAPRRQIQYHSRPGCTVVPATTESSLQVTLHSNSTHPNPSAQPSASAHSPLSMKVASEPSQTHRHVPRNRITC